MTASHYHHHRRRQQQKQRQHQQEQQKHSTEAGLTTTTTTTTTTSTAAIDHHDLGDSSDNDENEQQQHSSSTSSNMSNMRKISMTTRKRRRRRRTTTTTSSSSSAVFVLIASVIVVIVIVVVITLPFVVVVMTTLSSSSSTTTITISHDLNNKTTSPFSSSSSSSSSSLTSTNDVINNDGIDYWYDPKRYPLLSQKLWKIPATDPVPKHLWDVVDDETDDWCLSNDDDDNDISNSNSTAHSAINSLLAIIIGTQKGGSTALGRYLDDHPQIYSYKHEVHFLDVTMDHTRHNKDVVDINHQSQSKMRSREGTTPTRQRRQYWRRLYNQALNENTIYDDDDVSQQQQQQHYQRRYVIDKTPTYMFIATRVPQRIVCLFRHDNATHKATTTTPTTIPKIMVVLREPIDRLYSQYNMFCNFRKFRKSKYWPTLDEWIEYDLTLLVDIGILPSELLVLRRLEMGGGVTTTTTTKVTLESLRSNVPSLRRKWNTYTKLVGASPLAPIGRGLYAIQLLLWIESGFDVVADDVNKNGGVGEGGRRQMLVLKSEQFQHNATQVYDTVCDFLGLHKWYPPPPSSSSSSSRNESNTTTSSSSSSSQQGRRRLLSQQQHDRQRRQRSRKSQHHHRVGTTNKGSYKNAVPMSNHTRTLLQHIFHPYNLMLEELLDDQSWHNVWNYY
jgi:Sulfotransferase family